MIDRRELLKAAAGGLGAMSFGPLGAFRPASAQRVSAALSAVPLSDGVTQVTGAGANVVVLRRPDGLALVDSGAPERSADLAAFIADAFPGAPVQALFNTHWHLANTGGNETFREAGARIYAHENTKLWMSTEFYVTWQDRTYAPRPEAALPTDTFYSHEPQPLRLDFGGRQVEYGHLPEAHTDGDIYVLFPEDNVIVAGGAAWKGAYPILDYTTGGWIGGMADATRKLIDLADAGTRIVPESGPALMRADLEAQHEMLETVHERVADLMRKGKSAREMLEDGVTRDFDARWGNNPRQFVSNVYDGMWWGGRLGGAL